MILLPVVADMEEEDNDEVESVVSSLPLVACIKGKSPGSDRKFTLQPRGRDDADSVSSSTATTLMLFKFCKAYLTSSAVASKAMDAVSCPRKERVKVPLMVTSPSPSPSSPPVTIRTSCTSCRMGSGLDLVLGPMPAYW